MIASEYKIDNDFAITRLKNKTIPQPVSFVNGYKSIVILTRGKAVLAVNGSTRAITARSLQVFFEDCSYSSLSGDADGYHFRISNDFYVTFIQNKKVIPYSSALMMANDFHLAFTKEAFPPIAARCRDLMVALSDTHHFHRKNLAQLLFTALILDVSNVVLQQSSLSKQNLQLNRPDKHILAFMQLLESYGNERHNVAFYANQIGVSPQYLSLIIKNHFDKTAYDVINDVLMSNAKYLLRSNTLSVQDIAFALQFSDQSAFSKAFTHYAGISPLKFRLLSSYSE